MPLASIINMREFINNVEVLCQMSKSGCYVATIRHNAHLCGASRNNRFLFKTSEISPTYNCALADIYQYQLLKLPDQTTNFQRFCKGGDRSPDQEFQFICISTFQVQ